MRQALLAFTIGFAISGCAQLAMKEMFGKCVTYTKPNGDVRCR